MIPKANTIKVIKLDKRHTGHQWYTHRVTFDGDFWSRVNNFCAARDWLADHFGKSREVGFVGHLRDKPKPVWCWQTEYSNFRLYLSQEAMTHFVLVMDKFKGVND